MQIYVIGGADVKSKTEHVPRALVCMFDVDTRTWHRKAEMTQSRACLTTVVLGTCNEYKLYGKWIDHKEGQSIAHNN